MEMIAQVFQQADTNRDGSVTKAELAITMQSQVRGARNGGGSHTRNMNTRGQQRGPGEGERPRKNNPFAPGQVLPQPIVASLNLNKKQTRQLATLQADVTKRLAAILTEEQKGQLQSGPPPHGPAPLEGSQRKPTVSRPDRPAFAE